MEEKEEYRDPGGVLSGCLHSNLASFSLRLANSAACGARLLRILRRGRLLYDT